MSEYGSGSAGGGGSARSILARLAQDVGSQPRVTLNADPVDGPPVEEVALRRTGRYRILGQIAQGGVGRILKGRDIDLSRDVAIKALRDRHIGNSELVRRFVEEAQIGGQLQHPGIVPVYELGLQEDDLRPFLAMKLVKGSTLSALLRERKDPSEDLRRFVAIFEQICQTMAYAHARGVIHRDLKPSNIMVGAFGEVQVVDWGFAKVLATGGVADERRAKRARQEVTLIATLRSSGDGSESVAGSVMGTPAYMPPEQALGQVDHLDERSDVFCLGGILCAILTGEPTHVGANDEVLVLAARGDVDAACERLAASGADAGLIDLAKRCLSPLKRDRPRDAAAVAREIADHQHAAEERAHSAELAAIEARRRAAAARENAASQAASAEAAREDAKRERAKAERAAARAQDAERQAVQDRRARRLTISLAAVVVLLAVGATAGYLSSRADARERVEASSSSVEKLLQRAELSVGRGELDEAAATAQQAVAVIAGGDVDTDVQAATTALVEDIEKLQGKAARTAAAHQRQDSLRDALEEVRLRFATTTNAAELDSAFLDAFARHGIPLTELSGEQAAQDVRALGPATEDAVAALDEWAWLQRSHSSRDEVRGVGLAEIAVAVDPDPLRNKIRRALAEPNVDALTELSGSKDSKSWPARTVSLLGYALSSLKERELAIEVLDSGWHANAGDVWVNLHLARAHESLDPPRYENAARYYTAAWALRPQSTDMRAAVDRSQGSVDVLTPIRERLGYHDPERYLAVEVSTSVMTERRQRIYAEKAALVRALITFQGRSGFNAGPLSYVDGTTFVAESLDREGNVVGTQMTIMGPDPVPEFLAFDGDGALQLRFEQANNRDGRTFRINVPSSCVACHTGPDYFEPVMSFPDEEGFRRVLVDDTHRNIKITKRFLEGYHRAGGPVFGPYATIYLSKLRSDSRAGTLSGADQEAFDALLPHFPEYLDPKVEAEADAKAKADAEAAEPDER